MKSKHLRNLVLPPAPSSRTFEELAIAFASLRRELGAAAGEHLSTEETRHLRSAHLCLHQAALSLLQLHESLEAERAAGRVAALEARCRCGHDRGAHLVAEPHPCEPCSDSGVAHGCPGFVPATIDTLTEPPPASRATLVDELEGEA